MHKIALEEFTKLGNNNLPQGETGICVAYFALYDLLHLMNVVLSAYMLHTFLEPFSIFLIFKKILWPLFIRN